jgi:hypothetical protein
MAAERLQMPSMSTGHLLPGSHDEVRKPMDAYLRGDTA